MFIETACVVKLPNVSVTVTFTLYSLSAPRSNGVS